MPRARVSPKLRFAAATRKTFRIQNGNGRVRFFPSNNRKTPQVAAQSADQHLLPLPLRKNYLA
jgi:hypothetical protein